MAMSMMSQIPCKTFSSVKLTVMSDTGTIMNDTATTAVVRLSVSFLALVIYGAPERLDALNDNVSVSYGGEKTSVIFDIGAA